MTNNPSRAGFATTKDRTAGDRAAVLELLEAGPGSHCETRARVELPAGHTVIRESARIAYSFFVLLEGEAEVRREGSAVATLGPGDFFGELALILRRPRTATVELTAPSRLLSISAHNFQPLLMSSPTIQFKLLEAVAERLEARDPALVYA